MITNLTFSISKASEVSELKGNLKYTFKFICFFIDMSKYVTQDFINTPKFFLVFT